MPRSPPPRSIAAFRTGNRAEGGAHPKGALKRGCENLPRAAKILAAPEATLKRDYVTWRAVRLAGEGSGGGLGGPSDRRRPGGAAEDAGASPA